jgi:hypothetical protein
MSACNVPYKHMAQILNCNETDLKEHYFFQMEQGAEECVVNVASKLYELALDGNVTAITFWLSKKGGWKEVAEGKDSDTNKIVEAMSPVDKTQRILHILQPRSALES